MLLRLLLILLVAAPVRAAERGAALPELTADVLASCLDRAAELEVGDAELFRIEAQIIALRRALDELSLRWRSIAPTARIDAGLALETEALRVELRAARARMAALRTALRERLEARRITAGNYELLCVGRSYTEETLNAAEKLREAR